MTAVQERPPAEAPLAPTPPAPPWRPRWPIPMPARRPRRPRRRASVPAAVATWILAATSAVLLWFVFFALVLSSFQADHSQARLYSQYRQQLAEQTAPLGGTIRPGAPVALMSMPSAGITDQVVAEGTAARDLMNGPGHRRDTPLPGQAGVVLLYGRTALFGGVFGRITHAHQGDVVSFTTGQGAVTYRVDRVRHVGDPFPPPPAAGGGRLTLVTAEATGWRGGWAPSRPVYVDATLQGKAQPAPAGRLSAVPQAEKAMKGDVSALYLLVLWLPVLLIGATAVVWAIARWGGWQAWLVGTPIVLAGLWGVSQTAVQLLPNLA